MVEKKEIDWNDPLLDNQYFEEETEDIDLIDDSIDGIQEEEKPFDADKIRVDAKPFSVRQMQDMIKEGQLNLTPGFQRRKVWKERKRKSLLIESLMLRIPLPVFYVYEDEYSVWHVVDGLQRMSTINDYLNGEFKLNGLQYLKHSNGKLFSELDPKYKTRITTTTLTANVIDSRTPPQVKYDIFRRINTGGVPLNAQEIRNSASKPKMRKFLSDLVASEEFQRVTNGKISDLRMEAQELVIRFIAFYDAFDPESNKVKYKKSMETFIDEAFEKLNNSTEDQLKKYKNAFITAMKNAEKMFGKYAFRRLDLDDLLNPESRLKPHNKSLFTCKAVVLAHYPYEEVSKIDWQHKAVYTLAETIKKDAEFNESFTKGTGDPSRINVQFHTMSQIVRRLVNAQES